MPILLNEMNPTLPVCRSRQVSLPVALILAAGLLPAVGCNRGAHSAEKNNARGPDRVAVMHGLALEEEGLSGSRELSARAKVNEKSAGIIRPGGRLKSW